MLPNRTSSLHRYSQRLLIILTLIVSAPSALRAQDAEPASSRLPTLKDIPADLARNSRALFSEDNLVPLLVGAGLTAATHPADRTTQRYFAGGDRFGVLEHRLGHQLGRGPILIGAVGGFLIAGQMIGDSQFRRFTYDMAQATALNGLLTSGMKYAVGRTRPDGSNRLSFPSGHSSSMFAVATVIDHHYGLPGTIAGYAVASFVAASRLDRSKHYLSDVIAGATVGYIVGRTVVRRTERETDRTVVVVPILFGGRVGAAVSVSF